MKRREFIILTGAGATGATLLSACAHPEEKLIPVLIPDKEYVPGVDYWEASTCGMCSAGCGIVVRTREHKANKIEGNPLNPMNRGSLCARGQAGLQVLYNPGRIKGPMKRVGERGEGKWQEVGWDEGINTLVSRLRDLNTGAQRWEQSLLLTSDLGGATGYAARWLNAVVGTSIFGLDEMDERWPAIACKGEYCNQVLWDFDIANATFLLSFGARFLETWRSPVKYSLAYGEFRRSGKGRSKFVQVEPRMSLTGANADEWLPAAPGSEGLVALAIAQVIIREGLVKDALKPDFMRDSLDDFSPEKAASRADIPRDRIIRLAHEFAAAERPLAIGGGQVLDLVPCRDGAMLSNVVATVDGLLDEPAGAIAINYLNTLVGNINKPGGVLTSAGETYRRFGDIEPGGLVSWGTSINAANLTPRTNVLMVHNVNPVLTKPSLIDRIKAVPFIVSFSSCVDETMSLADLILPDHSFLESWDIRAQRHDQTQALVTISQPVVHPEHNTIQTADVLLRVVRELQGSGFEPPLGNKQQQAPLTSAEELVKHVAGQLSRKDGSIKSDSVDSFLAAFTKDGVWTGELKAEGVEIQNQKASLQLKQINQGSAEGYPFVLIAYQSGAIGASQLANLPALQELPDPMTSLMWGTWVEINPATAASLGVADGDLVEVQTADGTIDAPAIMYPAIRPDVIAMPIGSLGQERAGQTTERRPNVLSLIPDSANPYRDTIAVRAKVTKVGKKGELIKFGTEMREHVESKR